MVLYSIRLYSITSCIHNWVLFLLWLRSSFFLELFLHSSPATYWAPTNLGSSSFSVMYFSLFILFMGFSRQVYWSDLPFPSPVNLVLSQLPTMTHMSWVALCGMTHNFVDLDKAVIHMISLISFLWLWFSFCLLFEDKISLRGSWKLPVGQIYHTHRKITDQYYRWT